MKEIKFGVPITVNEVVIDVGDDDRGESVFSILMTKGCWTESINVTVLPKTENSYVKKGERDSVVEGSAHIERFCFELGSNDGIDYLKVDVAEDAWMINVW
jgi:hypothetical protein